MTRSPAATSVPSSAIQRIWSWPSLRGVTRETDRVARSSPVMRKTSSTGPRVALASPAGGTPLDPEALRQAMPPLAAARETATIKARRRIVGWLGYASGTEVLPLF